MASINQSIHTFLAVMDEAATILDSSVAYDKEHLNGFVRIEISRINGENSFGIFYNTRTAFGNWKSECWNDEEGNVLEPAHRIKFTTDDYRQITRHYHEHTHE